ncbi:MAG: diaminopimelate epimerase [Planctomycetota bacterium]|nr:diaminopimelate epimerase [Planctomycetota bacterium]
MPLHFFKYQGCGNDFVLIEDDAVRAHMFAGMVPRLCDRRFGIGCDQVLHVARGGDDCDVTLTIFNSDGSGAGMCGNGLRCVARHAVERFGLDRSSITVGIGAASYEVQVRRGVGGSFESATVQIPMVGLGAGDVALDIALPEAIASLLPADWERWGMERRCWCVSMGNPHVVFFGTARFPRQWLEPLGRAIESAACFPQRANVHFACIEGREHVSMLTWERGAGATLACGSGACAVQVAAASCGKTGEEASIAMPGGAVSVRIDPGSGNVFLGGPAACVFEGDWPG